MVNIRGTARAAILSGMLAFSGSCIMQVPQPVVAPIPSAIVARITEKTGWFDKVVNMAKASDFRPWQPIVEEIAGSRSVPSDRVSVISSEEINRECHGRASGCYDGHADSIYLNKLAFQPLAEWKQARAAGNSYHCYRRSGRITERITCQYMPLYAWAHEQGHHYDRHQRWVQHPEYLIPVAEAEADAFAFYAAEHLARNYDANVGIALARFVLSMRSSKEPLDSLMASGFKSFGALWYFIHSSEPKDVFERIRSNASRSEEGRQAFDDAVMRLQPSAAP